MKDKKKQQMPNFEEANDGKLAKGNDKEEKQRNMPHPKSGHSGVQKFISAIHEMERNDQEMKSKRKRKDCRVDLNGDEPNQETADSEDPEKAAIREKKRLKRQAKKETKKQDLEAAEAARGTAPDLALKYLHKWETDRDNWTFQKVRQVWLLQNMYDAEKIPDKDFQILLKYLAGLKGQGRQVTVEKAEKLLEAADADEGETPASNEEKTSPERTDTDAAEEGKASSKKATTDTATTQKNSSLTEEQYERVRQVIQILS